MIYTRDAMPSSEAPLVPSARGPLPEGPSPRWRRSAQGLRGMRLATHAGLATFGLATLALLLGERAAPSSFLVLYLFSALYILANVAFGAGLWHFGSVPASTGAARPARQSFLCFAAGPVLSLIFLLASAGPALARSTLGHLPIGLYIVWPIAFTALHWASLGLLVRALGAALRSLGETPPAWAPKALGALMACWLLLIALPLAFPSVVMPYSRSVLSLLWGLALVAYCAFALAVASVMGRTARALERQESPDTALR